MKFLYNAVGAVALMLGMSVLMLIAIGPAVYLYDRTNSLLSLLVLIPGYIIALFIAGLIVDSGGKSTTRSDEPHDWLRRLKVQPRILSSSDFKSFLMKTMMFIVIVLGGAILLGKTML